MNISHQSPKNDSQTNAPQRAPSLLISIRGGFSSTLAQWWLPNQLSIHLPVHFRECSALSLMSRAELHHKDKSLKKEQKDGVFSSIFKESEKSLFYIVSFIDKTCLYCACLSSRPAWMCDPSNRWPKQADVFLNHK